MEELLNGYILPKMIIAFILLLILLFIFFRMLFKLSSNLKVFFIALVVSVLLSLVFGVVLYMSNNQYLFNSQTKYYVYGKVQAISSNGMRVYANDTTLENKEKGTITVKFSENTVYKMENGTASQRKITKDDIKVGDTVEVMCEQGKVENNTVTAVKVLKREI